MTVFRSLLVACLIAPSGSAVTAAEPGGTMFVRGLANEPSGGFRQDWHTHLGMSPLSGVRQQKAVSQMEWKTVSLPKELETATVTFVWSGAMGMQPSSLGTFAISVNGHTVADLDVVLEPTEFPCRAEGCRFRYDVLFTFGLGAQPLDSSGHFYLTVPAAWLMPGEPAVLRVQAQDAGSGAWFAVIQADDAPLAVPGRDWRIFRKVERVAPNTPPPPGQEASYDWYLKQYPDPGVFTPIGPPSDPAETAVSPRGQLMYANDRLIPGTAYVAQGLAFALVRDGRAVPVGGQHPASQTPVDGYLPIVNTDWKRDDLEIKQTAFATPLRGTEFFSGLESTLAWAIFDITNRGGQPRELCFLAAQMGDASSLVRDLALRNGVVMEKDSARFSARVPDGFTVSYQPVFPADDKPDPQQPLEFLRRGGLCNVLVIRGQIPAGQTKRLVVNRVFDFPGALHWGASPPRVTPQELLTRSAETELEAARSRWKTLASGLAQYQTPDAQLNRMVTKATLDGYFLTKRWNNAWIVFDSVCYRCQWDDASTKWFYALDLMGDHRSCERLLDTVFARQGQRKPQGTRTREGCFSDVTNLTRDGSDAAWASCNGWALWAMAQHARLANDRKLLETHQARILDGCQWILRERQYSRQRPNDPCLGLISGKFVCDMPDEGGAGGVGYFTYTDAISYLGLHQMALLLAEWNYPQGEQLLREAEAYRQDIVAAVDRLTDRTRDPWYVPWVLHAPKHENEYFNGVCGPINLAFGGVLPRDDPRIAHVIRWNLQHVHQGSPEASATASMFYSQDLAVTLLELGRVEEFLRMFYAILASNVSHQTLTTCEWRSNTQPHIHSIASLIRMFRTMLIQERDSGLYLLQGTPRRWLEQGQVIRIKDAPTWYGRLSLQVASRIDEGIVELRLRVPDRLQATPVHLRLRLPAGKRVEAVSVAGQPHREFNAEGITLRNLQSEQTIAVRVGS
jgi:hypothetical protein